MARGFGRKAERTKKCKCNNPCWTVFEFTINCVKNNYNTTLQCSNCGALWDTKIMNDDIFKQLTSLQQENFIKILNLQLNNSINQIETYKNVIKNYELLIEKTQKTLPKKQDAINYYSKLHAKLDD